MKERKSKERLVNYRAFFRHRISTVLGLIFIALFLISAGGIPLSFYFNNQVTLWISFGVLFGSAISIAIIVLWFAYQFSKMSSKLSKDIKNQIKSFADGNFMTVNKEYDEMLPSFTEIQQQMNQAIADYSNYRLVFVGKASDKQVEQDINDGVLYEKERFLEVLKKEIQTNESYRSALMLAELQGSRTFEEKDFESLVSKIRETFPHSLLGKWNEKTLAFYVYNVESFLGLETVSETFVTNFNLLKVNATTGVENFIHAKLGGVIYPYCSLNSLVDEAEKALEAEGEVNLSYGIKDVYYPHRILSESSKRILFLANFEKWEYEIKHAKDYASEIEALKNAIQWLASQSDFEVAGVYEYGEKTHDYRLLFETARTEGTLGFSRFGNVLQSSFVSQFVNEAKKDTMFVGKARTDLPKELAEPILSLGMESFFIASLDSPSNDYGFIYMLSPNKRSGTSISSKEDFLTAVSFFSNILIGNLLSRRDDSLHDLLDNLASRTTRYLYSVDRPTHTITYMSDNLKHAFPNAHEGDICYKVLRSGHDKPCSHCPLRYGADHRVIQAIGPSESQISILQYRGANNDESTIMIERATTQGLVAGSHLVDDSLLIKNAQALSIDVNRELKAKTARGYIVSCTLVDFEQALKELPQSDANSLMSSIVANFQDAGYGELLYRFDTYSLSFLLKGYTKIKMLDFVEEAAEILSHPLEAREFKYNANYAFCAVAYPSEIVTTKQMAQTIKDELIRSASVYGAGYVVEVANRHPRKALRSEYILDILKSTLEADALPILTQPIVDCGTLKVIGGDIRSALYGRDKLPIAPREFIPIANKEKLVSRGDIGAISMMGQLYSLYGSGIFKTVGIKSLSMYLSIDSLRDPEFPGKVKAILERNHFPREYMHLEINSSFFLDEEEAIKKVMSELTPLGVVFECVDHTPDKVPLEVLKSFGVRIIKTERSLIWNAATNENELANFSRFLDAATRNDFDIYVTGIENAEQRDLAISLGAKGLEGYLFGRPMNEEDFIKVLNYGNKPAEQK
ncbi:MAG: EAL domain-containing protein [Bacilli bacterium]|nr:EAL domain-containing protein [Bacilli bacterium]